jgi:aminopeptidase YwaD
VDQSMATGGTWVVKANPYEGGSDHTPFVSAGIPGVLMWHFTDQHYHDDLDRIEMVSAPELQHVGNCALATSLILTAANKPAYARAAITEMAGIAERRLEVEGALSRATLSPAADPIGRIPEDTSRRTTAPPSATEQVTILEAWRDFYLGAIARIPEMTLPHLDLTAEVAAAQARVNRKAAEVLRTLRP